MKKKTILATLLCALVMTGCGGGAGEVTYSTGDVEGSEVGGFIYSAYYNEITNCYTTGDISGYNDAEDFLYKEEDDNDITNSGWVGTLPGGMPTATVTGFINNITESYTPERIYTQGSENMALSSLGVQFPAKIFANVNGSDVTITINNTSATLNNVISSLQDQGFNVDMSNGKLTIEGDDDHYITGMSNSLKQALIFDIGEGFT